MTKPKHQLLGLPLWAWGIGAGAFVIAIFVFFRSQQSSAGSSGTSGSSQVPVPTGTTSPTVYPFYMGQTPGSSTTQSQQFGKVVNDIGGGHILSGPDPAAPVLGFFNPGNPLPVTGPDVTGKTYGGSTSPGLVGISSDQWIPVSYGGSTGYLWAPEAQVSSSGTGGGPANTATGRMNQMHSTSAVVTAPYVF